MQQSRDAEFHEFVAARSADLLRTAYLLTGDRGHAEDLLQTVLARTYLAWSRIREPAARETYVRRAMVRERTSWWRRRRNREIPHHDLPETVLDDPAGWVDDRDVLLRVLAKLPPRQRACVVLRFCDDLSEAQVAAVLGCAVGTVKSQTSAALVKLRVDLGAGRSGPLTPTRETLR